MKTISRTALLGLAAAVLATAALGGGACSNGAPSDQGNTSSSSSGATSTSSSSGSTSTSSSSSSSSTSTSTSSSSGGDGGTGGMPNCVAHPVTYLDIINACTNAQQVALSPVLPLLEADGGLPPLP
jgi:hypothetical protein